jgi:uncharacterized delta-60 repeat protein
MCVARFRPGGKLDSSFGDGDGKLTTDLGLMSFGEDVTIQPDGKLVLVGSQDEQLSAVVRYEADGSLDQGFGAAGVVVTDMAVGLPEFAFSVALQDDGGIVVGGAALARYLG